MSAQYIRVHFPETRPVLVDGVEVGRTNALIKVREGVRTVRLGGPRDYSPKWRRPNVVETNRAQPLPVVFEWLGKPPDKKRRKPPAKRIFVSYAHEDRAWLKKLRTHLAPLSRLVKIEVWDDTRIKPGSKWRTEIRKAIRTSQVAVLLVSADFLASPFIADEELPKFLEARDANEMEVFWILVGDCLWKKTAIKRYQAAHDTDKALEGMTKAKRNKVLTGVALKIWEAFE